ncbi:hypothetical protein TPR58_21520 [Sphingomonas sp. HF-S3]|jgi:hypothetical protein|uniref:Uncharacterized protein n=1 Tax=Sphingomonas rustica TaxID=3103142 RepID=A0ABV0BG19_9SPHN
MDKVAGTILANMLSGAAWVFTHVIYGLLIMIYHRDVRMMAVFAAAILVLVLLVEWVL